MNSKLFWIFIIVLLVSCVEPESSDVDTPTPVANNSGLNLPTNHFNYANQSRPNYIDKDNTPNQNPITDAGATLGRVLFYDTQLSANNTISCASCHSPDHGFSDRFVQSEGLNGELTGRHSMRLVNARFAREARFFWDERAMTLEDQTTQPIQDHLEMGFSGENGQPNLSSLITRLEGLTYYDALFTDAFGSNQINEDRIQQALAQFIRSLESFDSKFDEGLAQSGGNLNRDFANFTAQENLGKQLFLAPQNQGGAGCAGCHQPPEFDIDPNSRNNGVIGVAGSPGEIDLNNTRSPSLRNLTLVDGTPLGPFMHDGSLPTLLSVIEHYDNIPEHPMNTNLDRRLQGGPGAGNQNLNLSTAEKQALVAFLETLAGEAIYNEEKWQNPFN